MGKKDAKHKYKKRPGHLRAGWTNFRPSVGGAGVCERTRKRRSAHAEACGQNEPH